MPDLMRFVADIQRIRLLNQNEPTVPGCVDNDPQRLWNGYALTGYECLDPSSFNDSTAIYVDSEFAGVQMGTFSNPLKQLFNAIPLVTPTRKTIIIKGHFHERIAIGSEAFPDYFDLIAYPNECPIMCPPTDYETPTATATLPALVGTVSFCRAIPGLAWGSEFPTLLPLLKGDYLQCSLPLDSAGRFYYFFPNIFAQNDYISTGNPTNYFKARNHYRPEIAGNLNQDPTTTFLYGLMGIQNLGYRNTLIGISGTISIPESITHPSARINNLKESDESGVFNPTAYPANLMPNGCGTIDSHPLGTDYSGWVYDICRCTYHPARFLAAALSVQNSQSGAVDEFVQKKTQYLTLYNYDGAQWKLWQSIALPFKVLEGNNFGGGGGTIKTWNWGNFRLVSAGRNAYWFSHNDIDPNFSSVTFIQTLRFDLVSTGGQFTEMDTSVTGEIFEVAFFKDKYYASTRQGLYVSENGIDSWVLVYEDGLNHPLRFLVYNNTLFFTMVATDGYWDYNLISGGGFVFNPTAKGFVGYTYDGVLFYKRQTSISLSDSINICGNIFTVNGQVCVGAQGEVDTTPTNNILFYAFQEPLINYEKNSDDDFEGIHYERIENIDINALATHPLDSDNQVHTGGLVTRGRVGPR